jgi:uncharacterized integral membrane protein
MRLITWLLRFFVFFALFAFALNNQHEANVRWFFGYRWSAPMVFIVLAAFGLGCAFGVIAMVPSWWKQRRVAKRAPSSPVEINPAGVLKSDPALPEHPPRDGL